MITSTDQSRPGIGHNGAPAPKRSLLKEFIVYLAHQAQIYYECHEGRGAINSQDEANQIKRHIRTLSKEQMEKILIGIVDIHNKERLAMKKYRVKNNKNREAVIVSTNDIN